MSLSERAGDKHLTARVLIDLLRLLGDRERRSEQASIIGRVAESALEHPVLRGDQNLRATLLAGLGLLAEREAHIERAVDLARQALAIRRRILDANDPMVGLDENLLGITLTRKASYGEARAHLDEALAIFRRAYGENHPRVAMVHNNLGMVHGVEGRPAEARKHFLAGLTIVEPTSRMRPVLIANLGDAEFALGHVSAARAYHEATLELRTRELGADHAELAGTLQTLAFDLRHTSEIHRALDLDRRALAITAKTLGTDHPVHGSLLAAIGEDLRLLGRPAESLAYQERAHEILGRRPEDSKEYLAAAFAYRGLALVDVGRRREAIPDLERALELHSPSSPDRARVAFALARALEPGRARSPRAIVLSLEALATFAGIGAEPEMDRVVAYLGRVRPR